MPAPSRSAGDAEEERPAVLRFQVLGHLGLVDHGRQLVQVAEHGEPHAAERLARAAAVDAQRLVDGPHEVGAHHRHLVDDEELEPAHDAAVAAAADVVGPDQARREAEEGVDGLAADVDGGKPGGRHDHHLGEDQVAERPEQRRLARAGAPGDEQVAVALAQEVERGQEFRRRVTPAGQGQALGTPRRGGTGAATGLAQLTTVLSVATGEAGKHSATADGVIGRRSGYDSALARISRG